MPDLVGNPDLIYEFSNEARHAKTVFLLYVKNKTWSYMYEVSNAANIGLNHGHRIQSLKNGFLRT